MTYIGPDDEVWMAIPEYENQAAVYNYREPDGRISFQKVKLEWFADGGERLGKSFRYRSYCDVRSGCIGGFHNEKPARANRLLYNLPGVLKAMAEGETIYICEGEKDCDLWMGATEEVATTYHQGAEVSMNMRQAAWLKDGGCTDVRVILDNDSAGAYAAWKICELLRWDGVLVYRPGEEWSDIGEAIESGCKYEQGGEELVKVDPRWLVEKAEGHVRWRQENWERYRKGRKLNAAESKLSLGEYQAGPRIGNEEK